MLLQPAADHERDRIDVAVDGVEGLARVLAARDEAAVAGADGIDEDEIGEVEPGLRVRLHLGEADGDKASPSSGSRHGPAAPNWSHAEDARARR